MATPAPPPNPAVQIVVNFPYGGRVDWASDGVIFYDRQTSVTQIVPYTVNSDGSNNQAVALPTSSPTLVGNPSVARTMNRVLFQVSNHGWIFSNPGLGFANNIYEGTLTGNTITSWTPLSNLKNQWVLHPKFSPNGKRVAWTQSANDITWNIVWGNADGTNLVAVNPLQPYGHFYEFGCWSDNSTLYFVATDQGSPVYKNIYSYNVDTGALTRITNVTGQWMEFPEVKNGLLAYVSSEATGVTPTSSNYPLDVWIRNAADGSNPQRLTTYNLPGSPQAYAFKMADLSWNLYGTQLAALMYAMPTREEAVVVITPSLAPD